MQQLVVIGTISGAFAGLVTDMAMFPIEKLKIRPTQMKELAERFERVGGRRFFLVPKRAGRFFPNRGNGK